MAGAATAMREDVCTLGPQGFMGSGWFMLATSGTNRYVSPFGSCQADGAHRCRAPEGTHPSWFSLKITPLLPRAVQLRPSVEKNPSVFCIGYGLPAGPLTPMSCEVYMQKPLSWVSRSKHFMTNGSEALFTVAYDPPTSADATGRDTYMPISTVATAPAVRPIRRSRLRLYVLNSHSYRRPIGSVP
jgi:hypothetical protein